MDKIIPLRINKALTQKINQLVEQGFFRNHNEDIWERIRLLIKEHHSGLSNKQLIAIIVANYLSTMHREFIQAIILFGSVAFRTDHEESDIDLLILTKNELLYQQEVDLTKEILVVLQGLDYIVSSHFQTVDAFIQRVKNHFYFETHLLQHGKILAGTLPSLNEPHDDEK